MILVDAQHVGADRPGRPLFQDLSLTVSTGDRIGLVGVNGTGKSTLLRILGGSAEPARGVVRRGRGITVGTLAQEPALPAGSVAAALGDDWQAATLLDRVGMSAFGDASTADLSGGQAKRVALARVLARPVDLLLLDEPTNHLDIDAIAWLEAWLASYRGGLVVVTHDRHVLDRVTTRMVELDRGANIVHRGGYASYLEARSVRASQAAASESTRRNLARAELAWLRRGAPARSRKPKARTEAAQAIVDGGPPPPARPAVLDLGAARGSATPSGGAVPTPRLGGKVIELAAAGHRFGAGAWLFEGLDLDLDPRGRLGVLGANGTGKTTLLDLMAGRLVPAAGHVARGSTVVVGYSDQRGRRLDPDQRVRDAVAGPTRQPGWEEAALMERFWFDADAQWAPIGTLSGGERRRLQLLLVLAERPNVLLLDEPTNDLDLDTLRSLEEYLEDWPGSLVVVSHDRAFLERTVDSVVALDLPGGASQVAGGYAVWEAARRAARPARLVKATPAGRAPDPASGHGDGPDLGPGAGGSVRRGDDDRPEEVSPTPGRLDASSAARSMPAAVGGDAGCAPTAGRPGAKLRSPSTLRRVLVQAEREMDAAAAHRDALLDELVEVSPDHVALTRVAAELGDAEERLAGAESRWLAAAEELGA